MYSRKQIHAILSHRIRIQVELDQSFKRLQYDLQHEPRSLKVHLKVSMQKT